MTIFLNIGVPLVFRETILLTYMIFTVKGSRWPVTVQQIANEKSSLATNKIVDSLLNYETIRYFTNQRYEHTRFWIFNLTLGNKNIML